MRPAPTAVQELLASRDPFVYADCYTFEFADGSTGYFTNAQIPITAIPLTGGVAVTWLAGSVKVSGARMKLSVGVSVDEQDLQIDSSPGQLLNGVPWPVAAMWGFFDGCILRRDRFFAPDWSTMGSGGLGGSPMFLGRISTLDAIGRQTIKGKVKSFLVLADILMPKELQQPGCNNTLYDPNCALLQSDFTFAGTCGAGSNANIINWSSASANFTRGMIQIATGANAGQQRTIKQASSSQLFLAYPLQFQPGVGDAFEASWGCDKTTTTCGSGRFNNVDPSTGVIRHRGFPTVPPPIMGT